MTLAAALLAAGVRVVGRGVYSGRPRGVYGMGLAEPNAYVRVEGGAPMECATRLAVHDGLRAWSLSGKAVLDGEPDRRRFDHVHAHCDVLVVGAGPAGLAAAHAAGASGARVVLASDSTSLPGPARLDGRPAGEWKARIRAELADMPEVRVLPHTLVTGAYDHGLYVADQRLPGGRRLWHIRAGRTVLATGAYERPIVFPGNDRPGVMLAGAAAAYDLPYTRAVVFTTNDEGRDALGDAAEIVDVREGRYVAGTEADADGVLCAALLSSGERVPCDLLAVSGGFDPATALFTGETYWSAADAAFLPDLSTGNALVVGAARGTRDLADALAEGAEAGGGPYVLPCTDSVPPRRPPAACWFVGAGADDEAYVDLNRDATLADVRRAVADGMRHAEHAKRYTTIGTGADQGRISSVLLAGVLSELLGTEVRARTTARPPVAPIPFALAAGRDRGELYDPARRTPMHAWHVAHGAVFEDVGQWKRPWFYPRDGEDMDAAVLRECRAAREAVAVLDYSTLGKIDLRGPDAGAFLDRIYTNRFSTLKPGRARYGVMCGADGMVADDGVTARLGPDHFHMTTTTGNAAAVFDAIEEWLFTEWPDLDVRATSVTEQWAVISLVGPRARDVMRVLSPGADLDGFAFMSVREMPVAGVPARVFRVSFTGELTYEINVPWWYGAAVWRAVLAAGAPYGITPYGTETMHVLRAEKGLIVAGQETDGTVTPVDAGLGWAVSAVKDFVGKRSLSRSDTVRTDRRRLVGLLPVDPARRLAEGAQLVAGPDASPPLLGHVTSSYRSAALGRTFALGLLSGEAERVYAVDGEAVVPVEVTDPVFYDPDNTRRDGMEVRR